jgi:hypothetical protein
MPIKQIKLQFQVSSDNDISTNVTVTNNGLEVFSGLLAQTTTNIIPVNVRDNTEPYQEITFDIDVPQFSNVTPLNDQFTNTTTVISCTGGNLSLQAALSNWHPGGQSADSYAQLDIPVAPLFDGNVDNTLYNVSDNYHVTGPGALPINQSTVVTVVHSVPPYDAPQP